MLGFSFLSGFSATLGVEAPSSLADCKAGLSVWASVVAAAVAVEGA